MDIVLHLNKSVTYDKALEIAACFIGESWCDQSEVSCDVFEFNPVFPNETKQTN